MINNKQTQKSLWTIFYRELVWAIIPIIAVGLMGRFTFNSFVENHPDTFVRAQITEVDPDLESLSIATDQSFDYRFTVKNSGLNLWPDSVRFVPDVLAQDNPLDNISGVVTDVRPKPGQSVTYEIEVNSGSNPGNHDFALRLDGFDNGLSEGQAIHLGLDVEEEARFAAELVEGPASMADVITFKFKNTGNTVWKNHGEDPLRLMYQDRDDDSADKYAEFFPADLAAYLDQDQVLPGEMGTFTFETPLVSQDSPDVTVKLSDPAATDTYDFSVISTRNPPEPVATEVDIPMLYAFPVGHGDAYLIRTPENENILYDTGHPKMFNVVLEGLRGAGVDHIDHLILSHSHWDHIGGAPFVMDYLPFENIYVNGEGYPFKTYERLRQKLEENSDKVHIISAGDEIVLKNGALRFYNPETELSGINENDDEVNNNSLVAQFVYNDKPRVLFWGDVGPERVGELLGEYGEELKTPIVTLPHHGVGDIDGDSFFDVITPYRMIASSSYYEFVNRQVRGAMGTAEDGILVNLIATD